MSGKKRARARDTTAAADGEEEEEQERNVQPRLSARDQMQLKLLASIPSLQQAPMRDHTGRRRATCVSSAEMAEGLANLIASHTAVAAGSEEHNTVPDTVPDPPADPPSDSPSDPTSLHPDPQQGEHKADTDGAAGPACTRKPESEDG